MGIIDGQIIKTEYIDHDPTATIHTKKKILDENNEWVDRTFVRIHSKPDRRTGISEAEAWCRERYGPPKYLSNWFKVGEYVVMDEQIYFFWRLAGE